MGGNSSSSSFCSGSSWPGFFPLASFSFFFCSLTACRLAISMFLWGIWAKQMVWNYGSSGLWLKLLTFFQYTTEKGKKGHTLIWDLMLLNLKTLLGRSNSLKVLVDSGVFKSGQGTSTTWPLWHRTRSLFSVCVNHLKQIQSVEYIFHPIIVTKKLAKKGRTYMEMRGPFQGLHWPRYTNKSNRAIFLSNHKEKHSAIGALPVQDQTDKKQKS